jgi:hypothetical protein
VARPDMGSRPLATPGMATAALVEQLDGRGVDLPGETKPHMGETRMDEPSSSPSLHFPGQEAFDLGAGPS